ncbi:thiamine/thiamine pyrophosphate ABC transporter permease ThiP [Exercitatus varius]|uniref:thiamine/thiamine pyrophosphate ABC transporter permease ThiP n=1 Tax=Exercitatus varius TaxID=67857 RepID=UPI00294B686A|nr:thiamine/thiamine pyrophosphate ABC transporter permease ThiP [Exercitatus varius]MDG2942535.1 thiamine/thiamine pyrophosphate ABC transporter permease ThiP [Exercitatus varius]
MNAFFLKLRRLRPRHYAGGVCVLVFLLAFYGGSLNAVFSAGETPWRQLWQNLWQNAYLKRVLWFSFMQAGLSALLSVIFGIFFARAVFYQHFRGKKILLRLFSLTFVLPSLAAVFGLLGVYGASGWLAQVCRFFQLNWQPDIYGLPGILLAHVFFNLPLAARLFLQSYQAVSNQQRQLAAQLGIRGWRFIRLIELPYLRQQIFPAFVLIFMLCFTSFAIVLALGGGPKYSTLEVAIYQAITFDFDLAKAALYASLQIVFCLLLFAFGNLAGKMPEGQLHQRETWLARQSSAVKFWQVFVIIVATLFIALLLGNIVAGALFSQQFFSAWQNPQLWRAMGYSFAIAPLSALISLLAATALLQFARQLNWLYLPFFARIFMNVGMLILAVPTLVLAVGLFLRLQTLDFGTAHLFVIVVICNALTALPFVIRILSVPMNNNMQYYENLCQSLDIRGWRRFRLIEWHHLAAPVKYAFALATALSLGDFTAIALFGGQDFTSLPYLLYRQLGSYRGEEAAVTAFLLLLVCAGLFLTLEKQHD